MKMDSRQNKFLNLYCVINKFITLFCKTVLFVLPKRHQVIPYFENRIIPLKLVYPLGKIKFEGYNLNVPQNTDKYLRLIYGDYEKLPPIENRKIHAKEIIFND